MKTQDLTHKDYLAILTVISAIGFGIAGTVIAPLGVIDSSMLYLIAQLLIFAATMLGFGQTVQKMTNLVNAIKGNKPHYHHEDA